MKVIIAGSRAISDQAIVAKAIAASCYPISEVVSGAARGVDQLGEQWARANGIPVHRMPADWRSHGRSAGMRRNAEMAQYAEALIAVWDGRSSGTKHMIECAHRKGLRVFVALQGNPGQKHLSFT